MSNDKVERKYRSRGEAVAKVVVPLPFPYDPRNERDIVGHPDLANGAWHPVRSIDRVYVSVIEAARRIMAGQPNVVIRWQPTEEDARYLAEAKAAEEAYVASFPP